MTRERASGGEARLFEAAKSNSSGANAQLIAKHFMSELKSVCDNSCFSSGHDFSRAVTSAESLRLQPLRACLRVLTQTLKLRPPVPNTFFRKLCRRALTNWDAGVYKTRVE